MSVVSQARSRRSNPLRPYIWGAAACLLLLPAVAMQFTGEVNWTRFDFIFAGVMLAAACGAYELGAWLSANFAYRAGFAVAIGTAFVTVWVNGAVGMVGSEGNPANLMFIGVLAVGLAGAVLSRFRPRAMSRAMCATAAAHALATAVVPFIGGQWLEFGLIACFTVPWLLAALLFGKAARDEAAHSAGSA